MILGKTAGLYNSYSLQTLQRVTICNTYFLGSIVSQLQPIRFDCQHIYKYIHIPSRRFRRTKLNNKVNLSRTTSLNKPMSYFVIGVSGVTCGGKTTLTKLLQRSFPWCRIIHQDHYFYDDDWKRHIRVPEVENHVNYEILNSMNMDKMYKDIQTVLDGPGEFFDGRPDGIKVHDESVQANSSPEDAPNFDSGLELLKSIGKLDFDTTKYQNIPVLILEGFIIFESDFIFNKCDVRFFVTLDKEECQTRRSTRGYNPPDCPGYFEKIVWPEYEKHFEKFIYKRHGIKVFNGTSLIQDIWKESVQIVGCRLQEKYILKDHSSEEKSTKSLQS